MKKVCLVTSVHPPFDTRIFHKEAASLVRAGYVVTLIAPHRVDETVDGIKIRALRSSRSRAARFAGLWRPLRAALAEKADVYHVHDPELIFPALALKALTRAKVVYDVHEDVPKDIMSKEWIPRALRLPVASCARIIEALAARAFDAVVAATPAIARNFPAKKTRIVQNMPVVSEFLPAANDTVSDHHATVCYIGAVTAIRGGIEMVKAVGRLPTELKARLALAGDFSPPGFEAELRGTDGSERVDFLGHRSRKEVSRLLRGSRAGLVLFHPERNHVESQPNKLFEYMAAGIPVVASDFALWREIIDSAGCGCLVDPRDTGAIARAIQYILENPREATAMGSRGRQAVLARYNWAAESEKLLALYKELTA